MKKSLDEVSKIDFKNLKSAMGSINQALKAQSASAAKVSKEAQEQAKKELNLLQQRAALHQKMVDAYSKNPKVDLSAAVKEYDRLNQKISDMYIAMGQPQKALSALKEAMIATGRYPWADGVVKQFSDLNKYLDDTRAKMKSIREDANGTTERVGREKAIKESNKGYDALEKMEARKAEQIRKANESREREEAAHQKKVEAQTQKEIEAYERQQRQEEQARIRQAQAAQRQQEKQFQAQQKFAKEQLKDFNQIYKLLEQAEHIQNRIDRHKGKNGLVYTPQMYFNELERINKLKQALESVGAHEISKRMNESLLMGVNMKDPVKGKMEPVRVSDSGRLRSDMEELRKTASDAYYKFKQTRDVAEKIRFEVAAAQLRNLNRQAETFERIVGRTSKELFTVTNFMDKVRTRAGWILTGFAEHVMFSEPKAIIDRASELELAMAGVQQVLPRLEGVGEGQEKVRDSQAQLNKEFGEFAKIAKQYGQAVDEVVDAGRSIGRMYGDGEGNKDKGVTNTNILTSLAAKMATVDNFDMVSATRGIESAMAQFNMQTSDSIELLSQGNRILDVWTKLAHNGGASAQDLTDGVRQAGSAAHQAGVSFEFLNALIATGVRSTAKSGNEIGTTLKSMFSSILSDKNIKNMEKFGIDIYKTGEDGTKKLRNLEDVILDISMAMSGSGANVKELRDFMMVVSGGKQQFSKVEAILGNYKELLRTIKEAYTAEGFSGEQLEFQMNTAARKLQSVKAAFDDLIMVNGNKGLLNDVKWILDTVQRIGDGFKKLDKDFYGLFKTLLTGTVALVGLKAVLPVLAKGVGGWQAAGNSGGHPGNWLKAQFNERLAYLDAMRKAEIAKRQSSAASKAEEISERTLAQSKTQNANASRIEAAAETGSTQAKIQGANANRVNSLSESGNTQAKIQNAAANRQEQVSENASTASKIAGVGATNALTTSERAATVVSKIRSVGLALETVRTAGLTVATRTLSAAMAALGGPIGIAVTILGTWIASEIASAHAAGELVSKNREVADSFTETTAKAEQDIQAWNDKSSQCERLAEKYNKLKDAIDSKSLSEEQAAKATEAMGEIEKTISDIMGMSAEEFKENGKIKISSISEEAKKHKEASVGKMEDIRDTAKANYNATLTQLQESNKRIEGMKGELNAVKQLGIGYRLLYGIMSSVLKAKANSIREQIKTYEESGLSDTTMTWGGGGDINEMRKQADEAEAKAKEYDEAKETGHTREEYDRLNAEIKTNEDLVAQLNEQKSKLDEIDSQIASKKADIQEKSTDDILQNAHTGAVDESVGGSKGGRGASNSGMSNPPVDDTQKNQNRIDKAEYDRLKNEYSNRIKSLDDAIKKVQDDEEHYGASDTSLAILKGLFDKREKVINEFRDKFKGYANELSARATELFDKEVVGQFFDSSKVEEGIRKVVDSGMHMDLHGEGCVEAVERMGMEYSDFLRREFERGVRYVPTLIEDAAKEGIETLRFDESQLEVGDLVVWKNNGDTMNHVGTFKGRSEDGTLMVADNSSGADRVLERPLYRNWQKEEYIIKTGTGNGLGGVSVPNLISHYISKDDWSKLDLQGKRDFVASRASENNSMEALLGQLENLLKAQSQVVDIFGDVKDNARQRAEAIIKSVNNNVSTVEREADYKNTDELFQLGSNASDLDRSRLELEKMSKVVAKMTEMLPNLPNGTLEYKDFQKKMQESKMEFDRKKEEYEREKRDLPIRNSLDYIEHDHNMRGMTMFGESFDDNQRYLADKKEQLEKRLANQIEEYKQARIAANELRESKLQEIEMLDAEIAKNEELVASGKMTSEELDKQKSKLIELKRQWNSSSMAEIQNEHDKQAAINKTREEIASVEKSQREIQDRLYNTVVDGTVNMFDGVLLQGKSFSEGWESLWNNIAQIAIEHMIKMLLFQKFLNPLLGVGGGGGKGKGFADGGATYDVMQGGGFFNLSPFRLGGRIPGYAHGGNPVDGLISGAGTGTSDSILTYLEDKGQFIRTSNGEFIVQKKAVDSLGVSFLNILNNDPEAVKSMKRYADGGSIGYEMAPSMSPDTMKNYTSYTRTKASNDRAKNGNSKLESLMAEQTGVIRNMGKNSGGDGKVVVLNTQASSADVFRALQENPRALNAILGRNERRGFR